MNHPNNLMRLSDVEWTREPNGTYRIDGYTAIVGNVLILRRLELFELDRPLSDQADELALDVAREEYRRGVGCKVKRLR